MKWKVLVTLLVVGTSSCFLLANRYSVVGTNRGVVYKTDRLTGRTWIIAGGEQSLIRPTCRDLHPDQWQAKQDAEAKRLADEQEAYEIERARLAEFRRQRGARIDLLQRAEQWLVDALRIAKGFQEIERELSYQWDIDILEPLPSTYNHIKPLGTFLLYIEDAQAFADEARGLLRDQPSGVRPEEIARAAAVLRRYSDPWPPIDEWESFGGKSLSLDDLTDAPLTEKQRESLAEIPERTLEDWRELAAGSDPQSEPWFEAKFHIISLLLETSPFTARAVMDQLKPLNPDSIPEPWAGRLRALDRRIDGRNNEGADRQDDGN